MTPECPTPTLYILIYQCEWVRVLLYWRQKHQSTIPIYVYIYIYANDCCSFSETGSIDGVISNPSHNRDHNNRQNDHFGICDYTMLWLTPVALTHSLRMLATIFSPSFHPFPATDSLHRARFTKTVIIFIGRSTSKTCFVPDLSSEVAARRQRQRSDSGHRASSRNSQQEMPLPVK